MLKVRLKAQPFLTVLTRSGMSLREFSRNEDISDAVLVQCLKGQRHPGPKVRHALVEGSGLAWDALFEIIEP